MISRKLHYLGWILFVISAVFFIITSKTILDMIAAVTFLLGCAVFLISMFFFER